MLKIIALRADEGGCAWYRIQLPAQAAKSVDPSLNIRIDTGIDVEASKDPETGLTRVHKINEDVDILIVQRPLHNQWVSGLRQARAQGITTIVEIDDDLSSVHPRNSFVANVDPAQSPTSNYEWALQAAHEADFVTVSTPRLAEVFAPHGRFAVLPNYIESTWLDISPNESTPGAEKVRVGWTGTVQTHPTDLQVTKPGLAQSLRDHDASFRVAGDAWGVREALGLVSRIDVRDTGWRPLDRYPHAIADHIDIGVVPLDDIPFAASKSWLKGLEFSALGIPFIASPVAEYKRLHETYGLGQLASTSSEWRRLLNTLITSEDFRLTLGAEYQEAVRRSLVSEDHGDEWISAWRQALDAHAAR